MPEVAHQVVRNDGDGGGVTPSAANAHDLASGQVLMPSSV